jgi:hypothetical protein
MVDYLKIFIIVLISIVGLPFNALSQSSNIPRGTHIKILTVPPSQNKHLKIDASSFNGKVVSIVGEVTRKNANGTYDVNIINDDLQPYTLMDIQAVVSTVETSLEKKYNINSLPTLQKKDGVKIPKGSKIIVYYLSIPDENSISNYETSLFGKIGTLQKDIMVDDGIDYFDNIDVKIDETGYSYNISRGVCFALNKFVVTESASASSSNKSSTTSNTFISKTTSNTINTNVKTESEIKFESELEKSLNTETGKKYQAQIEKERANGVTNEMKEIYNKLQKQLADDKANQKQSEEKLADIDQPAEKFIDIPHGSKVKLIGMPEYVSKDDPRRKLINQIGTVCKNKPLSSNGDGTYDGYIIFSNLECKAYMNLTLILVQ